MGATSCRFKSCYPHQKSRIFSIRLFLYIAKAMAYHHASACISSPQAHIINRRLYHFRNDDIQHFVLMIYNFCEIDDMQGLRLDDMQGLRLDDMQGLRLDDIQHFVLMIYKAFALILDSVCGIINSIYVRSEFKWHRSYNAESLFWGGLNFLGK